MLVLAVAAMTALASVNSVTYPKLERSNASEDFFGTKVDDPFRWLEDIDSGAARDFVARENKITAQWIPSAVQSAYHARLSDLMNYPKRSVPERRGPWWFTYRNTGLQRHSVLFRQRGADGEAEVLIDPNTFSADGTVALSGTVFSVDGALVAYAKSVGGSDDQTFYVRDVATGKDRADVLKNMRFGTVTWAHDNSGFWYNKFPDPASRLNSTIYWHRLGDAQDKDRAIFSLPKDPEVSLEPGVTEDGNYLVVYETRGTDEKNGIWLRDASGDPAAKAVFAKFSRWAGRPLASSETTGRFFTSTQISTPRTGA